MKTYAAGLDLGTAFLQTVRDTEQEGKLAFNQVRNCFRELDADDEIEAQMQAHNVKYLKEGAKLYVLGNDAFVQAGMAEFSAGFKGGETLQRPMKDGTINSDAPKISMAILRELQKACIDAGVGPARKNEIMYFSIPASPCDSDINVAFHAKTAERFLTSLQYDARPLGEALAVVYSENPKMHAPEGDIAFTGIGISFGAGQANFCLAERGNPLDEFSVCRSGDWLDSMVARQTGLPKTKVQRIKERSLNFDAIDESSKDGEVLVAYDIYYDEMIKYVFDLFAKRFGNNKGSIDSPIDIVLSGGTACPKGFHSKVTRVLHKMRLPFEIGDIRLAGGGDTKKMLQAVAMGCYLRAKQAAKKAASAEEVLEK